MLPEFTTGRRLAVVAAAGLLSVALPATPSFAQKIKNKTVEPVTTQEFSVNIPTVEAVDSSIDSETIKAILSGSLADNAEALAGLSASRIVVPEIAIAMKAVTDGKSREATVTLRDLVLEDVVDGVAASASLGGTSLLADEGSAEMGATSADTLDIAGILGIYGLVDAGGSTEMKTLYSNFLMEGGNFEAEDVSCEFGAVSGAEVRGRPLEVSFVELVSLAQSLEEDGDDVDPKALGTIMRMYADVLTAFESSEFVFDGLTCNGVDTEGTPLDIKMGPVTMAGMSPGIYPQISFDGFSVAMGEDGAFSLDSLTIKQFDLTPIITTLKAAPEALDEDWFEENARYLMAGFEGLSFSGFALDVPDPEADGERVVVEVEGFDLTLSNYINGIPSAIDTWGKGIKVKLPEDSLDESVQMLISMGVSEINAGFRVASAWDEATQTIKLEEISLSGVDLANVALSGTIANATADLFSMDENEMMVAGMGVAVKALNLDVTDSGLMDILLAVFAKEQGGTAASMRPILAGLAEGTIIGFMAGAAEAANLGSAVSSFVSGKARFLNIGIEAKEDPGLGMVDFIAAEDNPAQLIGKINVTASAK